MKKINVAVVGATGLVGTRMISILEERNFPVNNIKLLASARSAGKVLQFKGQDVVVEELTENSFNDVDVALFSAGAGISKKFGPIAAEHCYVIDNSSAWREDDSKLLLIPEVNADAIETNNEKLIANPNCSTSQVVLPLDVINQLFGIKRIDYSTYQAVSGSGVAGVEDLRRTLKGEEPQNYPHPIANNLLPHIDVFQEDGYTKEEVKMINETMKILGTKDIEVSATCVRVPVEHSHGVASTVVTEKEIDLVQLREALRNYKGITLADDDQNNIYPTALMAAGKDDVYVGRIRKDRFNKNTVHFFCTADNLRKGAALNTVQIAEELMKRGKL